MSKLASLSAFHGIAVPGRYGNPAGDPGVTVAERTDLGIASLEVRKDRSDALKAAVREVYGLDLPEASTVARGKDAAFIGTGPGQWLAVSSTLQNERLAEHLVDKLRSLVSISDQSSGRAVLRVSGPKAPDVLAKGLAIDLDPRAFGADHAATSTISHMGVLVWREEDSEQFDIALFRSVAESFWRWLSASAAEYGYAVVTIK